MSSDVKWISDLVGDMSMPAAARRVLDVRLRSVGERLPLALHHAEEDREHVHQLRVSTRRAGAAVRIFSECLPHKEGRAIAKALKRIRRAAGAARDWDVFQIMVAERLARATAAQKPAFDLLLGMSHGQRAAAQEKLAKLSEFAEESYAPLVQATLAAVDDASVTTTLRSQAVPLLGDLLRELDAAAAEDLANYERLHQVRILGKQLRYAMEIFATCFEAAFREKIYPAVEEMQEILGCANDSFVAMQRLHEIRARLEMTQAKQWPRYRPGLEALLRSHQRRLPEQRRLFLEWWSKWQTSGMEKRLEKMLRG
jgi:CHAD domain-containing protein